MPRYDQHSCQSLPWRGVDLQPFPFRFEYTLINL
jgi:hypothetical protein